MLAPKRFFVNFSPRQFGCSEGLDALVQIFLSARPMEISEIVAVAVTAMCLEKNQNAPRLSEHPPVMGKKMSKRLGGIIVHVR